MPLGATSKSKLQKVISHAPMIIFLAIKYLHFASDFCRLYHQVRSSNPANLLISKFKVHIQSAKPVPDPGCTIFKGVPGAKAARTIA
jgi:hypothetical protein